MVFKAIKRLVKFMKNDDRWIDFDDGTWEIERGQAYRYELFAEKKDLDGSKTFKSKGEAGQEIFKAIWDVVPPRDMYLPVIWGVQDGRIELRDLLKFHTLVAGATGEGKTSFLCTLIISLLHFSHPEYFRLGVFDPKGTELRAFKKVATYTDTSVAGAELFFKVGQILEERIKAGRCDDPNFWTTKRRNKTAYSSRKKSMVAPYILLFADEYAGLMDWAEQAKKDDDPRGQKLMDTLHFITSKGRSFGVFCVLSTQSPYSKYIEGVVKNNFTARVSFHVNGHNANMLVLEKGGKGEEDAIGLPTGHFLERQKKGRKRYRAVYSDLNTVLSATKNWEKAGLNWSI